MTIGGTPAASHESEPGHNQQSCRSRLGNVSHQAIGGREGVDRREVGCRERYIRSVGSLAEVGDQQREVIAADNAVVVEVALVPGSG